MLVFGGTGKKGGLARHNTPNGKTVLCRETDKKPITSIIHVKERIQNMKNMKKLLSLLLALVMVLAMGTTTAFAAGETGSVTVTNATIGKDYSGYKIFDATYSENGGAAYTMASNSQFRSDVEASGLFVLAASINDPNVLVVTLIDGKTSADVATWVKTLSVDGKTADLTKQTATANTVLWTGVPYGYI